MAYRTNQFYRINDKGGERGYYNRPLNPDAENSPYTTSGDNGGFLYPAREVRTADHNGYNLTSLRRGYMRSLRTQADGIEVEVKKCGFQFNPSVLSQSVVQAEGLLNVFQSDPSQYAQPIPGNVSFQFELLFDRTMEVNNPKNGKTGAFNPNNPWELSDPSEVGVLRDLSTLFATIGQGVSESEVAYLKQVVARQFDREYNDPDASGFQDEDFEKKVATIPDFLRMNLGNTSFLLPQPVRIVFSSLYIVEGFAQSTSVTFTKFSTQMVPLQAMVTVNVDAKYIGFAKARTFLTEALADETDLWEQKQKEDLDSKNSVSEAASTSVGSVQLGITPDIRNAPSAADPPITLYEMLFETEGSLPLARAYQSRMFIKARDGSNQTPMVNLFKNDIIQGALWAGGVEVYGPFDSKAANNKSQQALHAYVMTTTSKTGGSSQILTRNLTGTTNTYNLNAATASQWEKSARYAAGGWSVSTPKSSWGSPSDYYIVKYRATLYLKGDGQNLEGRGEYYELVYPNSTTYRMVKTINLAWPTYGQTSTGLVVPSNDSPIVANTVPGKTNNITGNRYQ